MTIEATPPPDNELADIFAHGSSLIRRPTAEEEARLELEKRAAAEKRTADEREACWEAITETMSRFRECAPEWPELPKRVHVLDAHGVPQPPPLALARAFKHRGTVLFRGATGAGKTHLAMAGARREFLRAWTLGMAAELTPAARQEFVHDRVTIVPARKLSSLHDTEGHRARASRARFCVIDDLGAEGQTKANGVVDVVCDRFDRNLRTWFTIGLSDEKLLDLYGVLVLRRLYEGALVINLEKPKA